MSEETIPETMPDDIMEPVEKAKAKGTFNIVNVLRDRGYPEVNVVVYIDETTAYSASVIKQNISVAAEGEDVSALQDEHDALVEKLRESAITFYLKGISESARDSMLKQAKKKYPVEFNKDMNPITGEWVKDEKESQERDELFTDLLWHGSIVKIEDAEGNVQENLGYTDVRDMRSMLPLAAGAKVTDAINKLRVSTAVFMHEVGEDFLAKP
jgi:hypothetical protein